MDQKKGSRYVVKRKPSEAEEKTSSKNEEKNVSNSQKAVPSEEQLKLIVNSLLDSEDESLANYINPVLTCPICLGLVYEPRQCNKCEQLFCKDDLYLGMQISKPCPSCRQPPNYSKLTHRHVLNQHQSYPTKGCPFSGCELSQTKLSLEQLLSHLQQDCDQIPVLCPLNCGYNGSRRDLSDHHLCPNMQITCDFCASSQLRKANHQCVQSLQYQLDLETQKNKSLQQTLQEISLTQQERFEQKERENLDKIQELQSRLLKHKEKKDNLKLQNSQMAEQINDLQILIEDLTAQLRERDDLFGSLQKTLPQINFKNCAFRLPTMQSASDEQSNNPEDHILIQNQLSANQDRQSVTQFYNQETDCGNNEMIGFSIPFPSNRTQIMFVREDDDHSHFQNQGRFHASCKVLSDPLKEQYEEIRDSVRQESEENLDQSREERVSQQKYITQSQVLTTQYDLGDETNQIGKINSNQMPKESVTSMKKLTSQFYMINN